MFNTCKEHGCTLRCHQSSSTQYNTLQQNVSDI